MRCKDDGNKYFKDDKLVEAESEYLKALDYLPTKEWPDPNAIYAINEIALCSKYI